MKEIKDKAAFLANIAHILKEKQRSHAWLNRLIFGEDSEKRPRNNLFRSDQKSINFSIAVKAAGILNRSVEELLKDNDKGKEVYLEAPETIGIPPVDDQRSPGAMSWTTPNINGYGVTELHIAVKPGYVKIIEDIQRVLDAREFAILAVKVENQQIMEQVRCILESAEADTITALELNVQQFAEKIKEKELSKRDRGRLDHMEKENMLVRKELGDMRILLDQVSLESKRHKKEKETLQTELNRIEDAMAKYKKNN